MDGADITAVLPPGGTAQHGFLSHNVKNKLKAWSWRLLLFLNPSFRYVKFSRLGNVKLWVSTCLFCAKDLSMNHCYHQSVLMHVLGCGCHEAGLPATGVCYSLFCRWPSWQRRRERKVHSATSVQNIKHVCCGLSLVVQHSLSPVFLSHKVQFSSQSLIFSLDGQIPLCTVFSESWCAVDIMTKGFLTHNA